MSHMNIQSSYLYHMKVKILASWTHLSIFNYTTQRSPTLIVHVRMQRHTFYQPNIFWRHSLADFYVNSKKNCMHSEKHAVCREHMMQSDVSRQKNQRSFWSCAERCYHLVDLNIPKICVWKTFCFGPWRKVAVFETKWNCDEKITTTSHWL